jgi:hypothetical protein
MSGDEERRIAATAHVKIYGDVWVVDQREPAALVDAYSLHERNPNPFEWLVYGGTEPTRSITNKPDPWLTWEWRTHLGQPAEHPHGEPATIDELRIAHNVAIEAGDDAAAGRWQQRIEAQLDRSNATSFGPTVRLMGTRLTGGVQPSVESWFECTSPMSEAWFSVRSKIEARDPLSLIGPDPTDRDMAFPPTMPTKLWRPRYLYVTRTPLNHRIGRERYWGYWRSRDSSAAPMRADGHPETTLVTVP